MRDHRNTVLVTGATGALGPQVVGVLHHAGFRVRTLSLDPPSVDLGDAVEVRLGNVTDVNDVRDAMIGIDAVVHMAALLHIVNPPPALRAKYELVNIEGTRNVVEAAHSAGVKRLVFFSTIAVYGPGNGQLLNEESTPCPDTFYAETKLAAENIVLKAICLNGEPLGVVLRLGAVYGARVKGNYQRLLHALARGRFIPIGSGNNRRTLIYDKDVANAVLLAVHHPDAAGNIYNVTDGQFHTISEINHAICAALNRTAPSVYVPDDLARFGAGLLDDIARLLGRRPMLGRAIVDKYTEDVAVEGRRIQADLGFRPQYDLHTGWQDAVLEMRRRGDL